MKRLILLASVLLTISATSVQAQSVICEKFGSGQIIANRVCPLGYVKKGEVATTNGGGFGNAGMQAAQDMINRNEADRQARLAREAAAAEAQRQRNYEAQQAAERLQQQNIRSSKLLDSARCLEGGWEIEFVGTDSETRSMRLDVTNDGILFVDGQRASFQPNTTVLLANSAINLDVRGVVNSSTTSQILIQLSLDYEKLIGSVKVTTKKEKFFGGTNDDTQTFRATGLRSSEAPTGCISGLNKKSSGTRGETIADGLKNLSDLYSHGILTEEEFNAAKRRLLGL
jgi:hypothetical protein